MLHWGNLILFVIVVVSIFMVLIQFESIEEVLRLESEVEDLMQRTEALEAKEQKPDRMTQIMFETFNALAMCVGIQRVSGRWSGPSGLTYQQPQQLEAPHT